MQHTLLADRAGVGTRKAEVCKTRNSINLIILMGLLLPGLEVEHYPIIEKTTHLEKRAQSWGARVLFVEFFSHGPEPKDSL